MFRQSVLYMALALVAVVFVIVLGYLFLAGVGVLYPKQLQIERKAVEQSKSFTDSHNVALMKLKMSYDKLSADIKATDDQGLQRALEGQQQAVVETMCATASAMDVSTVNPAIVSFLSLHGCSLY